MRLLFLNQYFPPDPAPTGVLFRELGDFFETRGHEVEYVASRQDYRVRKKGGRRVLRELQALGLILWHGLLTRRCDVVVSGSSPPCLLLVATIIAARHRARSIHWLMDLYPELAVALGELQSGSAVEIIKRVMRWGYRHSEVIALDHDMAARLDEYRVQAHVIPPWVPDPLLAAGQPPSPENIWIYSGNLGRAHEWETLLEAQAEIERRSLPIRLFFQGSGPAWAQAQERAAELALRQCEWSGYVPQDQLRRSLMRARVTVATQRSETRGLLWPSKLALLMELPRPILWVGPTEGAIARILAKNRRNGIFPAGDSIGIADWLEREFANEQPPDNGPTFATKKEELLQNWLDTVFPSL